MSAKNLACRGSLLESFTSLLIAKSKKNNKICVRLLSYRKYIRINHEGYDLLATKIIICVRGEANNSSCFCAKEFLQSFPHSTSSSFLSPIKILSFFSLKLGLTCVSCSTCI